MAYGVGEGLGPAMAFLYSGPPINALAALGISSTGSALKKLQSLQPKIKTVTGTFLIAIGIWMTLHYTPSVI